MSCPCNEKTGYSFCSIALEFVSSVVKCSAASDDIVYQDDVFASDVITIDDKVGSWIVTFGAFTARLRIYGVYDSVDEDIALKLSS
jgi:hypothetical protein